MMKRKICQLGVFAFAMFAVLGLQLAIAATTYADPATAEPTAAASPDTPASTTPTTPTSTIAPEVVIETFHAGLLDIMKHAEELGIDGRIDKLTPLMDKTFDLRFMASKTVGRHWRKLSDEEKARWVDLFKRFTTANYAGRFTGFTGEEFVTVGVEDAPRGTRVVLTKIIVPEEADVQLNYRMIERNGAWKVIDVFLNGTVSELALRRSEYSSALKRDGFASLLDSVEEKIEDLKSKDLVKG
jgi:phospholipid transport system substrate-binding protein